MFLLYTLTIDHQQQQCAIFRCGLRGVLFWLGKRGWEVFHGDSFLQGLWWCAKEWPVSCCVCKHMMDASDVEQVSYCYIFFALGVTLDLR